MMECKLFEPVCQAIVRAAKGDPVRICVLHLSATDYFVRMIGPMSLTCAAIIAVAYWLGLRERGKLDPGELAAYQREVASGEAFEPVRPDWRMWVNAALERRPRVPRLYRLRRPHRGGHRRLSPWALGARGRDPVRRSRPTFNGLCGDGSCGRAQKRSGARPGSGDPGSASRFWFFRASAFEAAVASQVTSFAGSLPVSR